MMTRAPFLSLVRSASWLCVLLAGAVMTGCTVQEPVAFLQSADSGTGPLGNPDSGTSGSDDPQQEYTAYCAGSGPPILVGDSTTGEKVCSGRLAERAFRYALCSCERLALSSPVTTDGFRGSQGPYVAGGSGGSVGTNGGVTANDTFEVGGALQAGGVEGILLGRSLKVVEGLESGGPLTGGAASVLVQGNARVRGDVGLAELTVGGMLAVPAERQVSGSVTAAEVRREPVDAVMPCDCDSASRVDVARYISNHAVPGANHNALIGLSETTLEGFTGEKTLELPCGRFYLSSIDGEGRLTLVVRGRTALFVGGTVNLGEMLKVDVQPPGGELDLFIGGDMVVAGQLTLGSPETPSRVRVYVGGAGVLTISAGSTLAANLYAPNASLNLSGNTEAFGSLFVHRVEASGALKLHYDADVLDLAGACTQ